MKRSIFIVLMIILTFCLILTGCNSTEKTTGAGQTTSATTSAISTSTSATTPAASTITGGPGTPKAGGTLRIISTAQPPTGSIGVPERMVGIASMFVAPILEALIRVDASGTVTPLLAESLEWSNNNTTLTLHLRKGVKFHDGTAFNAAAVVWNFDQRVAAKVAGTDNMASYESVDENTVRINLKKFDNTWFVQLRGTLGMMISPSWVKEKGVEYADWHPVGAGPFKFGEFVEKDYVKMVRNDDYWGGKPLLDAIVYKFIADGTTAQLAFQNGEAEVISVMAGGQNLATDLGPLGYKVLTSDGGEDLMFIPSVTNSKSPLANVKVRQAVEYAINKAAIAKNVGKGYFEPAYQYAGRTQTAYTPNFQGRVYDPEKAKQLLTEAGYPTGFKTTLFAASIMAGDEMPAVQANLKAVGIDADVQIIEIGRLIEMETKGWPEGLLESPVTVNDMFGFTISRYINRPAQPNNVQGIYWDSFYRPDELEAACQAYKITPFGPEEAAKGKEVVRILFEGVSAIPLWETHGIVVMQDYVQDYRKGLPLTSGLVSWSFTNTWLSNH